MTSLQTDFSQVGLSDADVLNKTLASLKVKETIIYYIGNMTVASFK